MALGKLRNPSDRSNVSTASVNTGTPNTEYFWACELNADKRTQKWSLNTEDIEDDGDRDYIDHSLFIRSVCLGAGSVEKEENIVVMESVGEDGEVFKGAIANLTKGVNSMGTLSFTIDGKSGVTFTLVEGSGPVSICGNHLLDYPQDEDLDISQTEESKLDATEELTEENEENEENEDEEDDDDEEEEMEEEKTKAKSVKRKAPVKANKQKKAKITVEEADDDDDDDDEDDDDEDYKDEDEESDDDVKMKKGKKDSAKKAPRGRPIKNGSIKEKDVKKILKKVKK